MVNNYSLLLDAIFFVSWIVESVAKEFFNWSILQEMVHFHFTQRMYQSQVPSDTSLPHRLIEPDIQLMFLLLSLSLSFSLSAAPRQRRLLRQLPDHQDVPVEEERQRRLRVQRLRPLPEAALGTSISRSHHANDVVFYFEKRWKKKNLKNSMLLKGSLLRAINLFPQRPLKIY